MDKFLSTISKNKQISARFVQFIKCSKFLRTRPKEFSLWVLPRYDSDDIPFLKKVINHSGFDPENIYSYFKTHTNDILYFENILPTNRTVLHEFASCASLDTWSADVRLRQHVEILMLSTHFLVNVDCVEATMWVEEMDFIEMVQLLTMYLIPELSQMVISYFKLTI